MSLLFFTAADRKYEFLAPLYIYFALKHNDDAFCEILLEDATSYINRYHNVIHELEILFPNRFCFRTVDFSISHASAIRFIYEPSEKYRFCGYVYIGDIDIFILEGDVENLHKENMNKNKIAFSNVIRNTKLKRLTGLHFAPMQLQYPLPDIRDLDLKNGLDENILFEIMSRKNVMIPNNLTFRPLHGIHISLNRHPFGRTTDGSKRTASFERVIQLKQIKPWRGIEDPNYRKKVTNIIKREKDFMPIYQNINIKGKNFINLLENICDENFDEYVLFCKQYVELNAESSKNKYTFLNILREIRKRFFWVK